MNYPQIIHSLLVTGPEGWTCCTFVFWVCVTSVSLFYISKYLEILLSHFSLQLKRVLCYYISLAHFYDPVVVEWLFVFLNYCEESSSEHW